MKYDRITYFIAMAVHVGKLTGWLKKSVDFVMSDLYEDTSRILAYEQIIT